MRQVFVNLLSNAVKYTPRSEHPRIDVFYEPGESKHAFPAQDKGVGFDMKYADRLFAPFQRLHRDRDLEGTGIGLATVERTFLKHYGRIWAQSEVGLGTTFYFTLDAETSKPVKAAALRAAKA
jgi:light-regulated signal transduction histidine kinase (bacteriophytochrome)